MSNFEPDNKRNYLKDIYFHLKDLNYKDINHNDPTEMNYVFSFLGVIFLITGFLSSGYAEKDSLNFFLLVSGQVILFILISHNLFELIPSVKRFLELKSTKFFFIFSVSSYFFYSRSQVSIILNNIFEVSGDSFTYSLFFGSIIYFLNHFFSYYIWLLLSVSLILIFNYGEFCYNEKHKYSIFELIFNRKTYILLLSILLTYITYSIRKNDISHEALPYKIYIIAKKLDFDSKSKCDDININQSVVYLGSSKERILVSNYSSYFEGDNMTIYSFMRDKEEKYLKFNESLNNNLIQFEDRKCYLDKQ